jgi:hypothetical protein
MKWCKQDIEQVHEIFTSFHGLAGYPLYIILWTCSISFLHHFMDLLDILFTSFCMMLRGYLASPWNDVKRILSKFMKWCKEDIEQVHETFPGLARYPLYIISWTCWISSLHHFMDVLDILFTISSKSMKWCKEDIEQIHEMM